MCHSTTVFTSTISVFCSSWTLQLTEQDFINSYTQLSHNRLLNRAFNNYEVERSTGKSVIFNYHSPQNNLEHIDNYMNNVVDNNEKMEKKD